MENFVVECRRKVQLEMLRNDLHVYLKILQSAMVELINKDYADFVNLSTNLVCYCRCVFVLLHQQHYFLLTYCLMRHCCAEINLIEQCVIWSLSYDQRVTVVIRYLRKL